eukprot:2933426-Rhodomonas_salina.3
MLWETSRCQQCGAGSVAEHSRVRLRSKLRAHYVIKLMHGHWGQGLVSGDCKSWIALNASGSVLLGVDLFPTATLRPGSITSRGERHDQKP